MQNYELMIECARKLLILQSKKSILLTNYTKNRLKPTLLSVLGLIMGAISLCTACSSEKKEKVVAPWGEVNDSIPEDDIFDLDQMKFYIYVLKEKKKYARAAVRQYRLDRLIAAIMSSGKGTKDDPWVVICPEHEYNIVNFLGYVATDHQELDDGKLDYIAVKPKDGKENVKGFYFDVSRMMQVAMLKFPDK